MGSEREGRDATARILPFSGNGVVRLGVPAQPLEPLHVVCQDGQPYGSSRRCCSYCGAMCWPGMKGSAARWVDNWPEFDAAPDRCAVQTGD